MNRAVQPVRSLATRRVGLRYQSTGGDLRARYEAERHHAGQAAETWKKICYFVAVPALIAAGVNSYNLYSKHVEHLKHHPPQYVNYEYMAWRARPFFWGNNSLFFNPAVNHDANEDV
ncbi:cytochrome c oxidase, subunit VIa [Gongronella butleri]|nr:cytochrome c oxidase, subunit VIa [Gongronella butleri]